MKTRLLILALLLMAALPPDSQAQYGDWYYHRVGDTVDWDTRIGYYSWWEWEYFFQHNLQLYTAASTDWSFIFESNFDSCIQLQYFYTPVPLKIIGIAGACIRGRGSIPALDMDTNGIDEYLFIYEVGPGDTLTQVSATQWSPFDPKRYIHFWVNMEDAHYDSCCNHSPFEIYVPISEYYFDDAIWVTDSFYVGGSFFGNITPNNGGSPNTLETEYTAVCSPGEHHPCDPEYQGLIYGTYCTFPSVRRIRRSCNIFPFTSFSNSGWTWLPDNTSSVIIYPIIEVDTTVPPEGICVPVGNIEALSSDTSVTVTWDDFPNYTSVFLRYGQPNVPFNQWTEVNVTDVTLHTLTGLNPSTRYGVSLQAFCDKKEMPWSDPVYFYTGSDTSHHDTTAITPPSSLLATQTFLQPNPAYNEVTLSSCFNIHRIEIHDVNGILVYSEPAVGHLATLHLGFLRAGTYIVTLHTHNGTTHKKLIIQR